MGSTPTRSREKFLDRLLCDWHHILAVLATIWFHRQVAYLGYDPALLALVEASRHTITNTTSELTNALMRERRRTLLLSVMLFLMTIIAVIAIVWR